MLFRPPRTSALSLVRLAHIAPVALAALAAPLAIACTTTTTTTTTTDDSTTNLTPALIVRPREFLGDVPCSAAPGAMRSYTATLFDHLTTKNEDTGETVEELFTFPTSIPTSCGQGVRFDNGSGGHFYSVQIEGYEDFADDIGPAGWLRKDGTVSYAKLRSGSRHMVNRQGEPVTPRWIAACGEGENDPTLAAASGTTLIRGCDPLEDVGELGATAIEIDPMDALGAAACAGDGEPGQAEVATFDVQSLDGFGTTKGIPCKGGIAPLTYQSSNLAPGKIVSFYIAAHAVEDGPVTLGATCSAEVKEGLTVRAACTPLSDSGALKLDFAKVLAADGYACGADFATYDAEITLGDETITEEGLACDVPEVFSPLKGTTYSLDAKVIADDGKELYATHCEGEILPGRTTLVTGCIQK